MEKNSKVIGVIQARMGSSRLRGKVLKRINNKTVIQIIYERLKASKELDGIVLATSHKKNNDVLVNHAKRIGLPFIRGSENDVLSRHLKAAKKLKASAVVIITADCPFVDPEILDRMILIFKEKPMRFDLITNCAPRTFPIGLDIDIISHRVLFALDKKIVALKKRELYVIDMINTLGEFRVFNLSNSKNLSKLRWTLDYAEDLEFISKVFERLDNGVIFKMKDILALLKKEPHLSLINNRWVKHEK